MTDGTDPFAAGLRTDAERDAFAAATRYADEHDLSTPPERAYLQELPGARSVVARRLLRGLVRGAPDALPEPEFPEPTAVESAARRAVPALEDADWPADPLSLLPGDGDRVVLLPLPGATSAVCAPIEGRYGYGRLRLSGPIARLRPDGVRALDHPIDLVALLRRAGAFRDPDQADRIESELAESTANLALSRLTRRVHRAACVSGKTRCGERPAAASASGDETPPAADDVAALERLVTDGHPLHPSAKIRRGMSATAGLTYAPEFTDSIDVRFVAVHADRARETSVDDRSLTDRLVAAFDGLADAIDREVPGDPDEYAVIPVHPWQFHHVVPDRYERQREAGTVVPLSGYTRRATPLLNLRTVVPHSSVGTDAPPHCKLAIGVQLTNVERTVSPQAVHNGPRVTRVLGEIAATEAFDSLGFLAEPAATCYYPPGGPHVEGDAYDDVRHLSGLVRSNPRSHRLVRGDARVVPAAALVADSPATGDPLVRDVVERYADATGATDIAAATRSFVEDYVSAVVPDQLRLLSTYGVALESHLQNSAVVFADGRPIATLVRDFGGIRVHEARLADRDVSIEIYPDSDLEADGERDLYWKLYYALFQNHLTELIVALADSTPIDARDCWAIVRDSCRSTFEALRAADAVPKERVDRDEAALFAEPATHKALTTMRLEGKRHEYVTSAVPNPIADPSGVDRFDESW